MRRRKKLKKRAYGRPIKWKKFITARIILVLAFVFLIFWFSYLKSFTVKHLSISGLSSIKMEMVVSAYYHPLPKQKTYMGGSYWQDLAMNGYGTTYSGKRIQIGQAAADLNYYPIGSKLNVPGWGEVVVEDTGSFIRGPKRLDVFMGDGEEGLRKCLEWGKKKVEVEVVKIN